jgi:hypothetical protein
MRALNLMVERKPEGPGLGEGWRGLAAEICVAGSTVLASRWRSLAPPHWLLRMTMSRPRRDSRVIPSTRSTPRICSASLRAPTSGKPATSRWSSRPQSVEQDFIFEPTLTDSLGLEFGAHVLGQDVKGVPDLPDFTGVNFMGLSIEARYVVKHRSAASPIQVTLTVEPEWDAIGDAGQRVVDFNGTFRAIGDWQSADRRAYGAVNLIYTPDHARLPGQVWEKTSTFGASAALSYRVTPPLMFGAEADYDRAYDGVATPQGYRGQALYLGPTFHYQISEKIDFSAAFIAQATIGPLDLADFPRRLAKVRLEVEF